MALVEVDVVGLQTRQRSVDLGVDLVGAQAPAVPLVDRREELGGQHVGVARVVGEDLAPRLLGGAVAVDVGGVEEGDPGVERGPRARRGLLALDPARVGQPRPQRDLRDVDPAVAQLAHPHADTVAFLRS
jgi:hypothetical protein